MSTKIYNGYIVRDMTVEDLYPKLLEASDYVFGYLERQYLDLLLRLREREAQKPKAERKSGHEIDNMLRSYSKSDLDADSSIVLIPNQGDVLVMIFGGRQTEKLYLSKLPELENYQYWDNSEQPEEISEEDWDAIGERWGEVLRDWQPSSRVGLVLENSYYLVSLVQYSPKDKHEEILARTFPEIDSRR